MATVAYSERAADSRLPAQVLATLLLFAWNVRAYTTLVTHGRGTAYSRNDRSTHGEICLVNAYASFLFALGETRSSERSK